MWLEKALTLQLSVSLRAENEWRLGVRLTWVGSVSQWQTEAAAGSHCRDLREDTTPLTHLSPLLLSFSPLLTGCLVQPYQPLSLYPLSLSLFPNFFPSSLLSLIVSPRVTVPPLSLSLFSLAPSRFLLPLLLFSPPTSPCMERQLTASAPLLRCPSLLSLYLSLLCLTPFLSLVFQSLCKLSNLSADKVINTTLASLNIHHSALCIFLPCSSAPTVKTGEV